MFELIVIIIYQMLNGENLGAINHVFNLICHQMTNRSTLSLPVCDRCFFIITGKIIVVLLVIKSKIRLNILTNINLLFLILLLPLILEAVIKIKFGYASSFIIRMMNGFFQGFATNLLFIFLIHFFNKMKISEKAKISHKTSILTPSLFKE